MIKYKIINYYMNDMTYVSMNSTQRYALLLWNNRKRPEMEG